MESKIFKQKLSCSRALFSRDRHKMYLNLMCSSVIPKFMEFSQGTLALINNLTMPRGAYFQIFKEIIPNSKFAVII